ncbi:MAG TPA: S-layer homology domain-containing protein [Symbiobacteriaceae bacterium]|jgi:hypothetical protein
MITAALAALMLFSALPGRSLAATLSDIAGHWARTQVEAGVAAGYVSGYPDGTFRPDAPITRAEFFKLLGAGMRLAPSSARTGFAEESPESGPTHWSFAQGHIPAAVGAGLLVPSDYGAQFAPDTPVRRRDMLLAAVRALGQEPLVYQQERRLQTPDAGNYPAWLQSYAVLAMNDKVITGYTDGSLGLDRTATRAEALVIVQRILGRITLSLAPAGGPAGENVARHPGEGEPLWAWTATSGRPTVTAGGQSYTFPFDISDLALLPASGKAAWIRYSAGGTGVIGRLAQGKLTEIVHDDSHKPDLLAVGEDGRLWYTDGAAQLFVAGPTGHPVPVAGVSEHLRFGEIDWNGHFWGLGDQTVYQVVPTGEVTTQDPRTGKGANVVAFAVADDGTAWVLTSAAGDVGNRLEAVSLQSGAAPHKEILLGPDFGGPGARVSFTVTGRNGPLLWLTAKVDGADQTQALYRFDLTTGELVREVLPRSLPASLAAVSAPGGGVMLQEAGGKLWRILP